MRLIRRHRWSLRPVAVALLTMASLFVHAASAMAAGPITVAVPAGQAAPATVSQVEQGHVLSLSWTITNAGAAPVTWSEMYFTTSQPVRDIRWFVDGVERTRNQCVGGFGESLPQCSVGISLAPGAVRLVRVELRADAPAPSFTTLFEATAGDGVRVAGPLSDLPVTAGQDDQPVCTTLPSATPLIPFDDPYTIPFSCVDPEGNSVYISARTDRDGATGTNGTTFVRDGMLRWEPYFFAGGIARIHVRGDVSSSVADLDTSFTVRMASTADLSASITGASTIGGYLGEKGKVTVRLTNAGPGTARYVRVRMMPVGPMQLLDQRMGELADPELEYWGVDIPAGGSRSFELEVHDLTTTSEALGRLSVWVDADGIDGDPDIGSATPIATHEVRVLPAAPKVTRPPVVRGRMVVGQGATCVPPVVAPAFMRAPTYIWIIDGVPGAATTSTYRLPKTVAGRSVSCRVRGMTRWGPASTTARPLRVLSQRTFVGTERRDVFHGDQRDTRATSFGGSDHLVLNEGNDIADAGAGNDVVSLGPGNDRALLGPGNDRVDGGSGADTIDCGTGSDRVIAGFGADRVTCRDGRGDDVIDCGPGADHVVADQGDDLFGCERALVCNSRRCSTVILLPARRAPRA